MTMESEGRNEAHPQPPPPPLPATRWEDAAVSGDSVVSGDAVVIMIKDEGVDGVGKESRADVLNGGGEEEEEFEKVCRICHLSPDRFAEEISELILIGCGCKNELGTAHRHCAETWFRLKGNRKSPSATSCVGTRSTTA